MKSKVKAGIDLFVVAPGVWGMKDVFVNMYAILNHAENNWWLVDAGLGWSAPKIKRMAELLFGTDSKPAAIILTHGHFDHVGSVKRLSEEWDISVYAHHLEIPYLTGMSSYPPTDATVGGGLMADLSFAYPNKPINIKERLVALPKGGNIPGLPNWQYYHTPGHAPGHISLFRASDRVLIAGDAVTTTKTESAISTIFQIKKISGPPKYFTSDWLSAASSAEQLANLEPEILASGHGKPMRGPGMRKSLHNLVRDFEKVAIPAAGRYNRQPALMDDSGVVHIPPKNKNAASAPTLKLLGITAGVLLTVLLFGKSKKKKRRKALKLQSYKSSPNKKYLDKPTRKLTASAREQKPVTQELELLRKLVSAKSKDVQTRVKEQAQKIKVPAVDMLDHLKFKIKKRLN